MIKRSGLNLLFYIKWIIRKSNLKNIIYLLSKSIGLVDKKSVIIDGGLGSQIIGYMQYVEAKNNDSNVKCDVTFFLKSSSNDMFLSDVTYRKWQLDKFGISLNSLINQNHKKYKIRLSLADKGKQFESFFNNYNNIKKYNFLFPITNEIVESLKMYNINSESVYSVIHIRKGDFLKFASLTINDEKLLRFISKIKSLLNERIFILSDDCFDPYLKLQIDSVFTNSKIEYITGGDEITIHSLMRLSSILITSNSMFSLSASLLQKEGGVAILPKLFYSKEFKSHNTAISSLSDWMILSR
jgi:hypothetical protein